MLEDCCNSLHLWPALFGTTQPPWRGWILNQLRDHDKLEEHGIIKQVIYININIIKSKSEVVPGQTAEACARRPHP